MIRTTAALLPPLQPLLPSFPSSIPFLPAPLSFLPPLPPPPTSATRIIGLLGPRPLPRHLRPTTRGRLPVTCYGAACGDTGPRAPPPDSPSCPRSHQSILHAVPAFSCTHPPWATAIRNYAPHAPPPAARYRYCSRTTAQKPTASHARLRYYFQGATTTCTPRPAGMRNASRSAPT